MVKQLLMNILLSFIWVALTGELYFVNFIVGFVMGFFILWLMNRDDSDKRYFNRVPKIIGFIFFFLWEMIRANVQVAYDVITPKFFMQPGIIKYTMNAKTDFEINMLSTMVALTPGTIVVDVSKDKKVLYIHVMYLKDKEKFIRQLQEVGEKRLLEILR